MTPSGIGSYRELFERREIFKSIDHHCDLCGKTRNVNVKEIEHYESPVWLCHGCDDYIDYQPEKLAEIVKAFIIGNAL